MLASMALVIGMALGVGVWAFAGRGLPTVIAAGSPPTRLGWMTLALGSAAAVTFLIGSDILAGAAPALAWVAFALGSLLGLGG